MSITAANALADKRGKKTPEDRVVFDRSFRILHFTPLRFISRINEINFET